MADYSDFEKYADSPVRGFILPIIPVGAQLKPSSNIKSENLGKIPGLWYPEGWTGFSGWPANRATATMLKRWHEWQAKTETAIAVALNTVDIHAVDVDSDKQEIVNALVALTNEHLGTSMVVRCRHGSTRCVLLFKHEDHTA